jgi:hypothetical protein
MELYTEQLIPAVKEGAEQAGRSYDDIDRMIEIKLSYDTDPEQALAEHPLLGAARAQQGGEARHHRPCEMEKAADALPIEKIASRWIVGSDPDAVVADVKKYVERASPTWSSTGRGRPAPLPRAFREGPRAAAPGSLKPLGVGTRPRRPRNGGRPSRSRPA